MIIKANDFQDVFLATSLFPWPLKKILSSIDLAEKRQINSWKKDMKNMYTFNCPVHSHACPLILILAPVEIIGHKLLSVTRVG